MPNIREYTNKIEGLRPNEVGTTARQQAGRHIGFFFRETGSAIAGGLNAVGDVAVNYMTNREISHGGVGYAGLFSTQTDKWNDTVAKADPNDPTVAQRFAEQELEPSLEKFRQGFLTEGGQKWAEGRIQHLRDHFTTKMTADMAEAAAQSIKVNMEQTVNTLAASVYKDPTGIKGAMEALRTSFNAMADSNPNLKGTAGTKVKSEYLQAAMDKLVNTYAMGALGKSNNPEATLAAIMKDPALAPYTNPEKNMTWAREARTQMRLQATERRLDETEARRKEDDAFNGAFNDIILKTTKQDANGSMVSVLPQNFRQMVNDLAAMPGATRHSASVKALVEKGRQLSKEFDEDTIANLSRTSKKTEAELFSRMILPNDDPRKLTNRDEIREAVANRKLTWEDGTKLENFLYADKSEDGQPKAKAREDFIKRYSRTIDGAMSNLGVHSALGEQQIYAASVDLRAEEQRLGKDWPKLYDPNSPEFFGKRVMKYRVTYQDDTAYRANLDKSAKVSGQPAPVEQPPKGYPDARKAPDGNWYIQQGDKWFKVKQ